MVVQAAANSVRAAVVREKGGPFIVEELRLEEPRDEEVLVRIVATGMCHTDMVVRDQVYPCRSRLCSDTKAPVSSSVLARVSPRCAQATM